MASLPIGLAIARSTSAEAVDAAIAAEEESGYAVWSTVGGTAPDAMTIFAAAALRTTSIRLGMSIVPAYPRHPIVLASQALVLADLAPDRFHLGVGPSHKPTIEGMFGISMGNSLRYTREYVTILRQLLWEGKTDFEGEYFNVRASLPEGRTPPRTPILLSVPAPKPRTGNRRP
jgi:alkanesulfonate monooxygenase SsuD/methylene tetrahydromethanopterin reductase-like flavin-dependent oxidoreductase (luciferase family)